MSRILYIEDELEIAEIVQRWLEEDGRHAVFHAPDAQTGLALAVSEHPDLILLDLDLGKVSIDGWETNRQLKADPSTRSLPVIALTAHAHFAEYRELALSQGFVDYITKPFRHDELLDKVERLVRGDEVE